MRPGTLDVGRPNVIATPNKIQHRAVKKALAGLPVHKVNEGKYTIPVLKPQQDGLPFSMCLDLYRSTQAAGSSDVADKPVQEFFSLQYILDGSGQVIRPQGSAESIQSGDSILAPHSHTFIRADPSDVPVPSPSGEWQMASLNFLLPKEPTNAEVIENAAMPDAAEASPVELLSAETAARIVAGAGKNAQAQSKSSEGGDLSSRAEQGGSAIAAADAASSSLSTGSLGAGSERSDENGLRGDKSGANNLLETETQNLLTKTLLGSHQQGIVEGIRRMFGRLLASRRQGLTSDGPAILKRSLSDLNSFRLPHQTNRLALVFDPLGDQVNFTFGVEIFEPGHKTTPHVHQLGHEIFFILSGEGEGFCDGQRFPLIAGDVVVFPPGSEHGIDVSDGSKMYCLEVMQPNDMFAELVRAGMPAGTLQNDDLCILIAAGCSNL